MGRWVSQSVRDVCISHQLDWIYCKQPIKFLVVKGNGMWGDLISNTVQNDHIFPFIKEEEVFMYWVYIDIFCGLG